MCSALRFCLSVYFDLSPRGITSLLEKGCSDIKCKECAGKMGEGGVCKLDPCSLRNPFLGNGRAGNDLRRVRLSATDSVQVVGQKSVDQFDDAGSTAMTGSPVRP